MDPVKKYRIVFWIVFSVLILTIAGGIFYFMRLNAWKESIIASKDEKIALQATDLAKQKKLLEDAGLQSTKDKDSLASKNAQLKKEKDILTAENSALKAQKSKALAYNAVFAYVTSVIKTHAGFSGWTEAEFQAGKAKAEATGDTNYVSMVNWAWYETSVPPTDRVIRFWEDTSSGISNALK